MSGKQKTQKHAAGAGSLSAGKVKLRKRWIWLLPVFCFICFFFLATCTWKHSPYRGGAAENEMADLLKDTSPVQAASQLLPKKLVKIGFAQVGHESDWRIAATKSCREVFSEENGYALYFVDADNNPQRQREAVRNFIREQVDYIIIDPIVTTGWDAVLVEAYHARIPVLLIDRTIECEERYYTAWFGSDFVREGECAGAWLQNYLARSGRSQETISIVTINGTTGASAQIGRTQGFAKYLEKHANWHLLAQESGDFTEAGGRQVMERYLQKFTGIHVVICQNDNEALGACSALDEAGISYGPGGDVILISFDATRAGLQAVLDGRINADFECNPLSPPHAAEAILKLEAGETLYEKEHYLQESCFWADESPMTLYLEDGMKQMVPVTRELLDSRRY